MLRWGVVQGILAVTLLSVSCGVPQTATAARTLEPADVAKLRSAWQAAISPNGQHVAYRASKQRTPLKDPDGSAWTELYVMDANGKSRLKQ